MNAQFAQPTFRSYHIPFTCQLRNDRNTPHLRSAHCFVTWSLSYGTMLPLLFLTAKRCFTLLSTLLHHERWSDDAQQPQYPLHLLHVNLIFDDTATWSKYSHFTYLQRTSTASHSKRRSAHIPQTDPIVLTLLRSVQYLSCSNTICFWTLPHHYITAPSFHPSATSRSNLKLLAILLLKQSIMLLYCHRFAPSSRTFHFCSMPC